MIDHVSLPVRDFARSREFYLRALAPLGYAVVMEFADHGVAGLGESGKPDLWLAKKDQVIPLHVALVAKDRGTVDAFYTAAMEAGGKDNGGPGLRPHYHANYYAAFVYDPDGHNFEVVCHEPE